MNVLFAHGLLFFVITVALQLPEVSGYNCYSYSCIDEGCKTRTSDVVDCEYGCSYSSIKDSNVPSVKIRQCWDKHLKNLKDGSCVVAKIDGNQVGRICVCFADYCNGPDQDRKFDSWSSSQLLLGQWGIVALAIGVVAIRFF